MRSDGYICLVDRKKDMILCGGENVYTAEVESVLHSHPAAGLDCHPTNSLCAWVSYQPGPHGLNLSPPSLSVFILFQPGPQGWIVTHPPISMYRSRANQVHRVALSPTPLT